MKGVVFTELSDLVEATWGLDCLDAVLGAVDSPSGGAYTAVGTYDHTELLAIVVALSERTGIPVPDLVKVFGGHLLRRFADTMPQFFAVEHPYDFLANIDGHIHVEVAKLYPDAELPRFAHVRDGDHFELTYQSSRPFADLAEGLLAATLEHFGQPVELVERIDHPDGRVVFVLDQRG